MKNSKKESIKHENGSQLFEFCFLYLSKSKIQVRNFEFRFSNFPKTKWHFGYTDCSKWFIRFQVLIEI